MDKIWIWLLMGCLPYSLQREKANNTQSIQLRAVFWRATIRWYKGGYSWHVSLPFIEQFRH
jgi:hypothetical protein